MTAGSVAPWRWAGRVLAALVTVGSLSAGHVVLAVARHGTSPPRWSGLAVAAGLLLCLSTAVIASLLANLPTLMGQWRTARRREAARKPDERFAGIETLLIASQLATPWLSLLVVGAVLVALCTTPVVLRDLQIRRTLDAVQGMTLPQDAERLLVALRSLTDWQAAAWMAGALVVLRLVLALRRWAEDLLGLQPASLAVDISTASPRAALALGVDELLNPALGLVLLQPVLAVIAFLTRVGTAGVELDPVGQNPARAVAASTVTNLATDPLLFSVLLLLLPSTAVIGLKRVLAPYLPRESASRRADREGPSLVYLRSFDEDDFRVPITSVRRGLVERLGPPPTMPFHDVAARLLSLLGPVDVVMRPGSLNRTTEAGALTFGDDWSDRVKALLARAQCVLISATPGEIREGFDWELRHIGSEMPHHRVMVVVPPRTPEETAERWRRFVSVAGQYPAFRGLEIGFDAAQTLLIARSSNSNWRSYNGAGHADLAYYLALHDLAEGLRTEWLAELAVQTEPHSVRSTLLHNPIARTPMLVRRASTAVIRWRTRGGR